MTTDYLRAHPLADAFPRLRDRALKRLVRSVEQNGLLEHITLTIALNKDAPDGWEAVGLDGLGRHRACQEAGVEPVFKLWEGECGGERAYVWAKNMARRHLTASQRALVAARMQTTSWGGDRSDQDAKLHVGRAEAAREANVSTRLVATAQKVLNQGARALVRAVERGDIRVSRAEKIAAELDRGQQREYVKHLRQHDAALKYAVVFADPDWRSDRATNLKLSDLPVRPIVAPRAILYLWLPDDCLQQAIGIADSWGFKSVLGALASVPVDTSGPLFNARDILLVAARTPPKGTVPKRQRLLNNLSSLARVPDLTLPKIREVLARHLASDRGVLCRELLDHLHPPPLPRIDLFARERPDGWHTADDAPRFIHADDVSLWQQFRNFKIEWHDENEEDDDDHD